MAYRVGSDSPNRVCLCQGPSLFLRLFIYVAIFVLLFSTESRAQPTPPGYAQAQGAFAQLTLDQRVRAQILLTAAGYWPAVPNADFSVRLFNAICQFEVDSGYVPLGILNNGQMDRLTSAGGEFLNRWGFEFIRHPNPAANNQIWVPIGLPVTKELTSTGFSFTNTAYGLVLTYDFFPQFNVRSSFISLLDNLARRGEKLYYSKLYRDEFFALSYSDGITDAYVRYHQIGRGGVGFTLYWSHTAAGMHFERIATLISGSLWSSTTGAPFIYPFTVSAPNIASSPVPAPPPAPAPASPQQEPPQTGKSGTGFFVTSDGRIMTNAHVVRDCSEIHVGMGQGNYLIAHVVAKDPINDLALLKVDVSPLHVATLRFAVNRGKCRSVWVSAQRGVGDLWQFHNWQCDRSGRHRRRQSICSNIRAYSAW